MDIVQISLIQFVMTKKQKRTRENIWHSNSETQYTYTHQGLVHQKCMLRCDVMHELICNVEDNVSSEAKYESHIA